MQVILASLVMTAISTLFKENFLASISNLKVWLDAYNLILDLKKTACLLIPQISTIKKLLLYSFK